VAKQREIKYNIARLELQSDPDQGKNTTQDIASRKADYEIALSSIQKSMEENNAYYQIKFGDSCPRVKDLQSGLTSHQAIISLFVSTLGLHAFLITQHGFHYIYLDSLPLLQEEVGNWISLLSNTDKGHRFGNPWLENALYRHLVQPLQNVLTGVNEWIVIPDNIFSALPFESLPAGPQHHYLLETTTISYQLSARFMAPPYLHAGQPFQQYAVLSMAPFSLRGFWDNDVLMPALPGSLAEIRGLPGNQYTSSYATKDAFLSQVNRYPVIHLATHAVGELSDNLSSRICFYPTGKDPGENNLYLPELYALKLDSTDLIILSACESGKGELVDNEGMMSLSRGFLYAGCASTVNSLWAADDGASAFILHRLHAYLEKGFSKAQALRLAKLDYIHSDAIYTTPNYWANFILMGNTDPIIVYHNPVKYLYLTGLAILIGAMIIVAIFIWRAKSINPSRSSS
jgi:CHAT domain-containing protein